MTHGKHQNKNGLLDLAECCTILSKYGKTRCPTHCEHDKLTFCVSPEGVSEEDKERLEQLGVSADEDDDCFYSFRFGSA